MAKPQVLAKYRNELTALFAALPPKTKGRYYAAAQKAMGGREVTPDLLATIVAEFAKHGTSRKWKPDACLKKAFLPPFTAGASDVYAAFAKRMEKFDELFEYE